MRDSPSVHSQHSLNARLLRFRSQPHSEDAYALVEDLIDAGRHADARSVIGLAKPQDREDAALLLLEGRTHLLERDLIRAQAALLTAVKVEPELQQAYRYLGEVLLKRGDPLRARKTLRRALALGSDDEEARELLERAEYLVEAANDSLEALPSARDSEFDVDAQAELQAAEFVDQLPSEPASKYRSQHADAQGAAAERKHVDGPMSQFRFGRGRATEVSAEPASSHRQKTQADHVPMPPVPPRQRARRPDDGDPEVPSERSGSAGAFQAARPQVPVQDQSAWDSEPAAPHPRAREGTQPARKQASAGRDLAAADGAVPEPDRSFNSPKGAWTTQDAAAGDSEPALPHPAARAGVEPEPKPRALRAPEPSAARPSPQRRAAQPVADLADGGVEGTHAPSGTRNPASAVNGGTQRAAPPTGGAAAGTSIRDHDRGAARDLQRAAPPVGDISAAPGTHAPARAPIADSGPAVHSVPQPTAAPWGDDPADEGDLAVAWEQTEQGATRDFVDPAHRGASRAMPPAPPRTAAGRDASVSVDEELAARGRSSGRDPLRAEDGDDARARSTVPPRRAAARKGPVAGKSPLVRGRASEPAPREMPPALPRSAAAREPDVAAEDRSSVPADVSDLAWGAAGDVGRSIAPQPPSVRPAPGRGAFGKRLSDFRMHPGAADAHELPQAAAGVAAVTFAAESGEEGPPDADRVLDVVRQLGLFEDPSAQPAAWVERRDVEQRGQRVRGALFWLWGASLLLCVAGYFSWNQFVERRHEAAASLIAQARVLMSQGDHAALVDAERLLRLAREQHPASAAVSEEALFVQLQRVLEDGERDTAALRSAFARAQASHLTGPGIALTNLLLSAAVSDTAGRDRALAEVFAMAKGDARTLYLVGRAEERMGSDAAQAHLEAAASADPKLIPAQLALAERAYERGERAVATRMLDTALGLAPTQLRVRLFRMLVVADDAEPEKLRQDLNGLAGPLRKGNSIDRALAALVRARLARRDGEHAGALQAMDAAAASGVEDARVLSWLAEEALAIGNSLLAQQLASRALQLAPERVRSRRLLGRILVERGAGQQAFVLLSSLPATDVEVQVWKARAALLSNEPELLRNALAVLPTAWSKKSDVDVQRASLRLRIETQLEPTKAVFDRAQKLAHSAPTDPDALLALTEAALALHDAKIAQNALKQRALLVPHDVQTQTLLGRSLRMAGDSDAAEVAFRRALSLHPGYVEAQSALAALLLDRGQFSEADAVYRELALRDETALMGRLGRVEALLGQGTLADAQVQLEAAPESERATAAYREVAAKLALARGELAQALKLLGPLSEELPKRAALRAMHGEALLMAAQLSMADSELSAALALDPGLPEALLGRAELQLRSNKTKDALATLDKAEDALRERLRPPALNARRMVLLGRTLLQRKKRGDADAAARVFRQVTAQPAAPTEAYFFLGEALSAGKDKTGAQEAFRRYLELAPSGAYRQRAQRMLGAAR